MNSIDINGYENEWQFLKYLNGRTVSECHPLFQDLILKMFGKQYTNEKIKSWKNKYLQKTDIFIKIDDAVKRISLKKGAKNSVHVEVISSFIHFLITLNIPREIIISYLRYHYADGTTNGTGKKRFSVAEYKLDNQKEIDIMNDYFNKNDILLKCIERFLIHGRNDKYEIDAFIYGEVNDFLFLTKDEIKELIINKKEKYSTGVHFSVLSCQPMDRCLNYNSKFEKKRFCVQIKWFNIFDDIIEYKAKI